MKTKFIFFFFFVFLFKIHSQEYSIVYFSTKSGRSTKDRKYKGNISIKDSLFYVDTKHAIIESPIVKKEDGSFNFQVENLKYNVQVVTEKGKYKKVDYDTKIIWKTKDVFGGYVVIYYCNKI